MILESLFVLKGKVIFFIKLFLCKGGIIAQKEPVRSFNMMKYFSY